MSSRDSLERASQLNSILLERHPEGIRSWTDSTLNDFRSIFMGALDSVRLEEAKWNRTYWHEHDCIDGISQGHGGDIETCGFCVELTQRIADLEQAAAPKPSGASEEGT